MSVRQPQVQNFMQIRPREFLGEWVNYTFLFTQGVPEISNTKFMAP